MGAAIGEILPEAIGVAISPFPIIAVVLFLASAKGKSNAWGFLLGWLIGLGVVGVLVLSLADPVGATDEDGGMATWVGWLVLVLGALLIVAGVRSFLRRPRGDEEPPLPGWMEALDTFNFVKSLGIGFVLAAVNPKNLPLTVSAAAGIIGAGLSGSDAYVVLAVFVLIATLGLIIPILVYYLGGDRSADVLAEMRHWLAANNTAIMAVLFVIIGAKLLGSGLQNVLA